MLLSVSLLFFPLTSFLSFQFFLATPHQQSRAKKLVDAQLQGVILVAREEAARATRAKNKADTLARKLSAFRGCVVEGDESDEGSV